MAIVTFSVDRLPEHDDDQVHRVFLPDSEARSLVWEGIAGELIEFDGEQRCLTPSMPMPHSISY